MKKGRDYKRLQQGGLPIPDYEVFVDRCLSDRDEAGRLSQLIQRILTRDSGYVGVRTEPKEEVSSVGNYPHIMPLCTEEQVRQAMSEVLHDHPNHSWWFLVNEAFTEYQWNAVVMVSDRLALPGGPRLTGEVNDKDNLPLREALARTANCSRVEDWGRPDAQWLRSAILHSGLLNEWLEISSVYSRGALRKVFWGMR